MNFLPTKNTPRWIIFLVDLGVCFVALLLAYLIRFEFQPPRIEIDLAKAFLPIFLAIRAVSFVLGRTYAGIIRYTSTQDTLRIFVVLSSGTAAFAALNFFKFHFLDGTYFLPFSILIIEYLLSLFAMIVSRIAVKVLYIELKTPSKTRKRVLVFGAGEGGLITKRTIDRDSRSGMEVIAFLDDDKNKAGKKLEGADIYQSKKLNDLLSSEKVDEIILAVPNLPQSRKAEIIKLALEHNVKVSQLPPATQWIGGELSVRQIRDIRIEDLLGREPIQLDNSQINQKLKGKIVLITGAAGSIGSELARQVLNYNPKKLVLLDQAETPLFELDNELRKSFNEVIWEPVIGDVRQYDRMKRMMDHFRPDIIFHAAAYKHVPLMESNPSEAILVNVLGTKNLSDLAADFAVKDFIFISTDKAVNPTSVMGSSKRAAEMYVQSKNSQSTTNYITTRFGNVLGSNGSVIPIFKKQIEVGGPLTVTHEDVTRFFMTIPEASQLVLQASAMGKGGEIFAFDMGESVKIIDLAKNMLKLSGLEEGRDIEIKITGLRPGEKLYEEVLSDKENSLPTPHEKILIAKVREYSYDDISQQISQLISLFDEQNNEKIVAQLKLMIPEYVSNNSEFQRLDH
jgi:FlaA1/EpsC-like NDP-sugar epimerase